MTLTIELPDEVYAALAAESEERGCATPVEAAERALCERYEVVADEQLAAALQAGIAGGDPQPIGPEFWAGLRARVASAAKR